MSAKTYVGSIVVEQEAERPIEIIETNVFAEEIRRFLSDEEIGELKYAVACMRDLGDIIPGTGGLRKLRWGLGKGKRKGARVLYYYGGDHMPVYLIEIYKKSEKIDITEGEKQDMKKFIALLNNKYKKG